MAITKIRDDLGEGLVRSIVVSRGAAQGDYDRAEACYLTRLESGAPDADVYYALGRLTQFVRCTRVSAFGM